MLNDITVRERLKKTNDAYQPVSGSIPDVYCGVFLIMSRRNNGEKQSMYKFGFGKELNVVHSQCCRWVRVHDAMRLLMYAACIAYVEL